LPTGIKSERLKLPKAPTPLREVCQWDDDEAMKEMRRRSSLYLDGGKNLLDDASAVICVLSTMPPERSAATSTCSLLMKLSCRR
jgi:hypothetical protein